MKVINQREIIILKEGNQKSPVHYLQNELSSPRTESARAVTGRRCPHGASARFLRKQTWTISSHACPKYASLGTYGPCRFIWCPVGLLVGGCGARGVSHMKPIYFIKTIILINDFRLPTRLLIFTMI